MLNNGVAVFWPKWGRTRKPYYIKWNRGLSPRSMDLGRGPVGMRGCSWSVLEQSELRQVEEAVCV